MKLTRIVFLLPTLFFSPTFSPLFAQLQGTVVDSATQAPIANAQIRIQGRAATVLTDDGGFFRLEDTTEFPFFLAAGAHTYYNGTVLINGKDDTTGILFELEPVDLTVTPDHALNAPTECQTCHPDQYDQWRGSPMANTGLNAWVFDVLDGQATAGGMNGFVYKRDGKHRDMKPNSECSACHSPIHWLTDIETAGMGDFHNPNQDMLDGVQCEVCHRALDVDLEKINWPGVFPEAFTFLRGPQRIEFGLLGDVDYNTFIMRAGYNPQLRDRVCAACHEDNTDHDADDDYEDPGSVPHETSFSEYQIYRSVVGEENARTCVDCHMPATDADTFCLFGTVERSPGTIRDHDIRGTTPEYLENAVTMNTEVALERGILNVDVSITNDKAGHAVPTGVMIRNMILLVEAFDSGDQALVQLSGDVVDVIGGSGDPDQGFYAGLPGKSFYKNMADGENQRVFYTEADRIAEDTRIMPGETYQDRFRFELPHTGQAGAEVDLDVRLIYRRSFFELTHQKGWTETGLGLPLADIAPPHYGHLMERFETQVDACTWKDSDGQPGIDQGDLHTLTGHWQEPAPWGNEDDGAHIDVRHMTAVVNCY